MRPTIALVALAAAALLTSSCDTTQPLQLEEQTFLLSFAGTDVVGIRNFDVFDAYEDNNGDSQPDDTNGDGTPDTFLHCLTRDPNRQNAVSNPASVPWGYSVVISILRAGQTVPERITSSGAASDASFSLTDYDPRGPQLGAVDAAPAPVTIANRTFGFRNGRVLSSVRRDVMAQTTSPLVELAPNTYGAIGSGRCSNFDPGPSVVDRATSADYPRRIVLGKGDTVTIEAFMSPTPTPGIVVPNPPAPGLSATFTLNGTPMVVRGSTSEAGPGNGLRFAYTTN